VRDGSKEGRAAVGAGKELVDVGVAKEWKGWRWRSAVAAVAAGLFLCLCASALLGRTLGFFFLLKIQSCDSLSPPDCCCCKKIKKSFLTLFLALHHQLKAKRNKHRQS